MYNISSNLLAKLKEPAVQDVSINVSGVESSTVIGMSNIKETLSIVRRSVTGDRIEIGSVIASEMKLTLQNNDGRFDNFKFEGAELFARIAVKLNSGLTEYIPLGYFTVDNQPRKLDTISLTALDRMVKFAKPYDSALGYPASLWTVLNDCCSKCGVSLATLKSTLTNADYVVQTRPEKDGLTYWQVLQWVAELTGTCAWIDWDGKLRLTWYTNTSTKITPSDRFTSDMQENDIRITGVRITANDEEGTVYCSGTDEYMFNIDGNLLAQSDLQSIANKLGTKLNGFTYRPYTCTTLGYPHLWPMDKITFTDAQGVNHATVITNHTFKLNGASSLAAKGEPAQRSGYASSAPFTARQNAILERNKAQVDNKITDAQQAQLELNEVMANSMGLFVTRVPQPNGSVTVYYHNASTLESSTYIYTRNAGGFAWTDTGWNNGQPVWKYGVSKDGNAIMNTIVANKLWAELIVAGRLQSKDGSSFFDLDNGQAQLNGTFTAKSTSNIEGLGSSATLRGMNIMVDEDGHVISGGSAGLVLYDANGKQYGELSGLSLEDYKTISMTSTDENGNVVADIYTTSGGYARADDRTGSGTIYNTGNLIIQSGTATVYPTADGNLYKGSVEVYVDKIFSNHAVAVVTANTTNPYGCTVSCSRVSSGGRFFIYLARNDGAWETSVSWVVTEVKI